MDGQFSELLIADGAVLEATATACGYADYSGFCRAYTKYYGKSPNAIKGQTNLLSEIS